MAKKGVSGSFSGQTTITSVKFGNQCCFVGENAFKGCTSLSEINDDNVLEYIGSNAFAQTNLKSAKFDNLNLLYNAAFQGCSNLSYISIPNCGNIPLDTFHGCKSLNQIEIPIASSIGQTAFADCTSLTYINIPKCNTIGVEAFRSCTNLKSVNNPGDTITVSNYAFMGCVNLKDIHFNNIIKIGNGAFSSCISLDRINLKQCSVIGSYAFDGCSNLKQVTLNVCNRIGKYAFANCSNLNKVYINNNNPDIFCSLDDKYVFCSHNNSSNNLIHSDISFFFNAYEYDKYYNDENWSHYKDNMVRMVDNNQIMYTAEGGKIEIDKNIESELQIQKHEYTSGHGIIEFKEKVESLSNKIFRGQTTLTSVNLPSECALIEENAFDNCIKLNNITLSPNLYRIDDYAFKNCKSLTSFEIPESIEKLGDGIFAGCENIEKFEGKYVTYNGKAIVWENKLICVLPKDDSITEGRIHSLLNISDFIYHLGKSCFSGCSNMIRLDIDTPVQTIGDNAFEGCSNLYEVHFSESNGGHAPTLGENVFKDAKSDFKIFVPDYLLGTFNNDWSYVSESDETEFLFNNIYPKSENKDVIYYSDKEAQEPTVNISCPNGKYYKISNTNESFSGISSSNRGAITEIILGEKITKIGGGAFGGCSQLKYIYMPDSITELNSGCFTGCNSLTRVHIPSGFKTFSNLGSNGSANVTENIQELEYYKKEKVTFGNSIFYPCKQLKEFTSYYKGYVTEDNRCYIDRSSILRFFAQGDLSDDEKSYTIPDGVVEISESAFRESKIEKITLSPSIKTIGSFAFGNCLDLQTIETWDGVETISTRAFIGCTKMGKISLPQNLKTISEGAFQGCISMYIKGNIPSSVTTIGGFAFSECKSFKCTNADGNQEALNLENISYIDSNAFYRCEELTEINLNDEITRINNYAFQECKNLGSVYISTNSKLNHINTCAFKGCASLYHLYLPNNLEYIGNSAFEDCVDYKFSIPDNVSYVGTSCFKNTGIETLKISNTNVLSTIPYSSFENCTKLTTIYISNSNIYSIGNKAFSGCTLLCNDSASKGNLNLPNTITSIGDEAFNGCKNILSVTLPSKLTKLGHLSFATGTQSTSIYIPSALSTPPTFTLNGVNNTYSNPFGDMAGNISIIPKIYVYYTPQNLINTYKTNSYWKKYESRIYTYGNNSSNPPGGTTPTPTPTPTYSTKITFTHRNPLSSGLTYNVYVDGSNKYSVNSGTQVGTLGTLEFSSTEVTVIVFATNASNEKKSLNMEWTGSTNVTLTPAPVVQKDIPQGATTQSSSYSVTMTIKRNNATQNSSGTLLITLS